MLTIYRMLVILLVGQLQAVELEIVMDKLNTIDVKIGQLSKTVNEIEIKMNENSQRSNGDLAVLTEMMEEITRRLSELGSVKSDAHIVNLEEQNIIKQIKLNDPAFDFADANGDFIKTRKKRQIDFDPTDDIGHVKHGKNETTYGTDTNNRTDAYVQVNSSVDSAREVDKAPHLQNVNKPNLVDNDSFNDTIEEYIAPSIVDFYQINESISQFYEIIVERLGFIEEALQTVVEDREYMRKDIDRVAEDVADFALQVSDAIQDSCEFDYLSAGIDDVLEDMEQLTHAMNSSIDNLSVMNETLKLHIAETIHQSVGNFTSCSDLATSYTISGVYNTKYMRLYCDQETDGGGWTVFQRRRDGSESFHRNWKDYKNGFGHLSGEFWLGNEKLTILTRSDNCELFINMTSHEDFVLFAKYSKFKVHSENDGYRLEVNGFTGDAEDGLKYHNGMQFSTYDRDNDYNFYEGSCAQSWESGWWYKNCYESDLNGRYRSVTEDTDGVIWQHFTIKYVEMKLRCS